MTQCALRSRHYLFSQLCRAINAQPHSNHGMNNGAAEVRLRLNSITFNHILFVPQLLRLVTVNEKRWRARSRGGGVDGWSSEEEEGFESGDCDDEDECTGVSGLGPPPRRKRLRVYAGQVLLRSFIMVLYGVRVVALVLKINFNCNLGGFK